MTATLAQERRPSEQQGLWPDVAAARAFLASLAGIRPAAATLSGDLPPQQALAGWLAEQGLAPLAFTRCRETHPALARLLEGERYAAVAANSIHRQNLQRVTAALATENIPAVLLKGAALAETSSLGWDQRAMSDVDIWLQETDMPRAARVMEQLGFATAAKETRPVALQMMSDGELQYYCDDFQQSLVELHLSPYPGWWLKRTAAINKPAIWSRVEPIENGDLLFQLSAEDNLIQTAMHMTVNHQCSYKPIRSLLDMAQIIMPSTPNWPVVVQRARKMRVSTALWLALALLDALIGPPGLEEALPRLQPPLWQRRALQRLISPQSLLLGADLSAGRMRFLYLLLLVDRKRDVLRLAGRTIWPEAEWLEARYGQPVTHWHHLTHLIQHAQI